MILGKIEKIADALEAPTGVPPRQADEGGKKAEGATMGDLATRIQWVKEVLMDKERALVGLGWTKVGEQFTEQRRGVNARQQVKDEDILKAAKDPSKTKAGGPLEGMLIEGIYESSLEGLAEHVQAVQEEYTVAHWHSRMMKDILVVDTTGEGRTKEEAVTKRDKWRKTLEVLHEGLNCKHLGRLEEERRAGLTSTAKEAETEIPESVMENMAKEYDPRDKEQAATWVWVDNKIKEIDLMLGELEKVEQIAELFNSRAAPENKREEVEAAYMEALSPPTTAKEVREMFSRLPSGKTGGKSGCCREHYVHAPNEMLANLTPLIEEIYNHPTRAFLRNFGESIKERMAVYRMIHGKATVWTMEKNLEPNYYTEF